MSILPIDEQVIKFLLDKYQSQSTNIVSISRNDVKAFNISEKDMSRILFTLQEDGYVNIKAKSVHNDFSRYWEIALKTSCIHYFKNKKEAHKKEFSEKFHFWLPLVISIIALLYSMKEDVQFEKIKEIFFPNTQQEQQIDNKNISNT